MRSLWNFIFLIVTVSLISFFGIRQLRFEYDLKAFFSKTDQERAYYDTIVKSFAQPQEILVVGLECQLPVLTRSGLSKLDKLTKEIQRIRGVSSVSSLTTVKNYIKTPLGIMSYPLIHTDDYSNFSRDSQAVFRFEDVYPKFISKGNNATCLYIYLDSDAKEIQSIADQMHLILSGYDYKDTHIYGSGVAAMSYEEELKSDMVVLSSVASVLIIIFLYMIFKSFRLLAISIFTIGLTVLLTMGIMGLLSIPINMMTVIVPAIISILSLSDVIHVVSRYQEGVLSPFVVVKEVNKSIFLTSLTTLLGFGSLLFSGVLPFIQFGMITCIGIAVAYVFAIVLLPTLITISGHRNKKNIKNRKRIKVNIYRYNWTIQHRKMIFVVFMLLGGISILFAVDIKKNSYLYDDIKSNDKLSRALNFFEREFFGIRGTKIIVKSRQGSVYNQEVLLQIDKIESYLQQSGDVNDTYSVNTELKRFLRMLNGGNPIEEQEISRNGVTEKNILDFHRFRSKKVIQGGIVSFDEKQAKILAKSKDFGSKVAEEYLIKFHEFIDQEIDQSVVEVRVTGDAYLLDRSNAKVASFLSYSLLAAIVLVGLMIGLLYRSWKIVAASLIPNLLPILILVGLMGVLDIGINIGTAVIFTIAFGIAVDDTIHFIARLRVELGKHGDLNKAMKVTFISTGRAMLITSVVLVLGFGVFVFSGFYSTMQMGLLVSFTLIVAFVSDLVLLPCLIWCWFRQKG